MFVFSYFKKSFLATKIRLRTNTLESVLWLVNIVPSIAGFSIQKERVWMPFFIVQFSLLFYVYATGIVMYQIKQAGGIEDFIKSYFNISLLALVSNANWWWLKKRPLLKAILKDIEENDRMSRRSSIFEVKHKKLIRIIKWIIIIFYSCNLFNAFFIYWPNRVDVYGNYYMTPCVGLEPLTASPNREICMTMLALQEIGISTVVLNFQALLLLLIAHTAVMYQLLSHEMMLLNDNGDDPNIKTMAKELLPFLIRRHSLTLHIVDKLKALYSVPLGVNFGSNAVCMILFFYLPLQEWLKFMPIMIYCFLVFFLYCFLCQRLVNASEDFERAVYCCGWENFDLREKKSVYVMLRQAQKPVQLLAADIIPVNIYTFATTLQAMFKFVTVVKI